MKWTVEKPRERVLNGRSHDWEKLSTQLTLCEGGIAGVFPSQTASNDVFLVKLSKVLIKSVSSVISNAMTFMSRRCNGQSVSYLVEWNILTRLCHFLYNSFSRHCVTMLSKITQEGRETNYSTSSHIHRYISVSLDYTHILWIKWWWWWRWRWW